MAFGQGARSGLTYVVESVFGQTPLTPQMIQLPINSHSLNLTKTGIESAEIRDDRQVAVFRHGNKQIGGDIEVEFRADDYDELLESAFFGEFDSFNVLKNGILQKFFTIEDRQLDINQYRTFTGCQVNTFSLSIQPDAIVTTTFSVIGKEGAISGTSLDSTPTAPSGNDPFDSFSGSILEAGNTLLSVTALDLTVENNIQPAFVIGSDVTPQLEYGRSNVTGTITAFYENDTLINKFINETDSELVFSLADGITGNTYTFTLPRVKYNGADVPLQNEQGRTITLPFVGLYDPVEDCSIFLTRS
ncbi:MAG: phage tail tube protein [Smithella sp.]